MQLIQQELLLLSLIALGRSNLTNHKNATRFFYCFHDLLISVAWSASFGALLLFHPIPFTHCRCPSTLTHCPHPRGYPRHSHPLLSRVTINSQRPRPILRGVLPRFPLHRPPHSRIGMTKPHPKRGRAMRLGYEYRNSKDMTITPRVRCCAGCGQVRRGA